MQANATTTAELFGVATADPYALAVRAYVWGFPLVEAAKIRLVTTNPDDPFAPRPLTSTGAPLNRFGHSRVPAGPSSRVGVGINVDTLYSSARLDLLDGPFLFQAPNFGSRYYTFQMAFADSSAEVSYGQRTHGAQLPPILVCGPDYGGTVPSGVLVVRSPTRYAHIAGRILFQPDDDGDLQVVHGLQDRLSVRPFPNNRVPHPAVPDQRRLINRSNPVEPRLSFLEQLGNVLRDWTIAPEERELVDSFQRIGLSASAGFDPAALSRAKKREVLRGLAAGESIVRRKSLCLGENVNGWTINYQGCRFGLDYLLRAAVAKDQIFVTTPEEAIYPVGRVDSDGEPLTEEYAYRIRFEAGDLPPVDAFWSITMYDDDGFLVDNPLDRYALGDRTPDLVVGDDGGIEILIKSTRPSAGTAVNWLPAPAGPFYLMMRLYIPRAAVLDRAWLPPGITKVLPA